MHNGEPTRNTTRDDSHLTFKLASKQDAAAVYDITDAAYSKYIPRLGRKPEPMTVDYVDVIAELPVHILMIGDRPVGVLVLKHEEEQTLIWSVAVHPEFQGRGLGLRLLELAEQEARVRDTEESDSTQTRYLLRTSLYTDHMGTRKHGMNPS